MLSGYKLREKIGKALKTRAEAIRTALSEYNRCAAKLKRPPLTWNEVLDMVTLAEFDLLRETREDIRQFSWAQPLNRQAMNLYFNVCRAQEEIKCLNVEIPRLFTFLLDQHYDYQYAIAALQESDPAVAHELRMRWTHEDRVSARITKRLFETSQLAGFSGRVTAGKRVGRTPVSLDIPLPTWASSAPMEGERHADGQDDDERSVGHSYTEDSGLAGIDDEREAQHFVDFLDRLGEQ